MKAKTLDKYQCNECRGQFIITKEMPGKIFSPVRPYCGSIDVEKIARDKQENVKIGNLTIFLPD